MILLTQERAAGESRRGIVLLVVIALLTLFAAVALSFVFYADACDNANPGSGFDTFTITLPDIDGLGKSWRVSGTIGGGDIALSGSSTPTTGTLNATTTTGGATCSRTSATW